MGKLRASVAVVGALAATTIGLTPMSPASSSPNAPRHDVGLAIPMICNGQPEVIHVSAHLPRKVKAGRAFTISNIVTDVQLDGQVNISTSGAIPQTISAGTGTPSTTQLVADGQAGDTIEVAVTGASYVIQGSSSPSGPPVSPGTLVICTPEAPVSLGTIRVVRPTSHLGEISTAIDVDHGTGFHILGAFLYSGVTVRSTFTVPTQLISGQTFSLPDLQVGFVPDLDGAVIADPTIVVAGTDVTKLTPTAVVTVTAQPGETVEIYLQSAIPILSGSPIGVSYPLGSGHLASIPVVAG
ncbi:MAG TPA: hypothetical protein VGJ86_12840 [Acidimicrobiales bacterium]|jgi:hypothetical protein